MKPLFRIFVFTCFLLCFAVACTSVEEELESDAPGEQDGGPGGGGSATKATAVWKRVSVLRADLSRALELGNAELCQELDALDCFSEVHLAALGGNEPFKQAQYTVIPEPSAISAVAVERVVLAACSNRVDADRALNANARVFTHYSLAGAADATDANFLSQFDDQNTELYRRILARDPSAEELTIMRKLLDGGEQVSHQDLAKLSCFAIATTSEFLFI